jgi:hypothetical protein
LNLDTHSVKSFAINHFFGWFFEYLQQHLNLHRLVWVFEYDLHWWLTNKLWKNWHSRPWTSLLKHYLKIFLSQNNYFSHLLVRYSISNLKVFILRNFAFSMQNVNLCLIISTEAILIDNFEKFYQKLHNKANFAKFPERFLLPLSSHLSIT